MSAFARFSRRRRFIRPYALFLGVACGFLVCCLEGRIVSRHDHYPNFSRFHQFISPTSLHYPTVSECLAVAESNLEPGQVAVVVGGNSVLFGIGQGPDDLWTVHLQKQLGSRFRVFNFALNGGSPGEFGSVVAEALSQRHREVLCVTNAWAGTATRAGPAEQGIQPYFFWDAYYKGLLPRDPEREAHLAAPGPLAQNEAYEEAKRKGWLDSLTYANDLWTAFSCRRVSTVWCPAVAERFWAARRSYSDPMTSTPVEKRYNPSGTEFIVGYLNETLPRYHLADAPAYTADADYSGTLLVQTFQKSFPPSRRANTLVLVNHLSPYIWRRLDPSIRERYTPEYAATVQALRQAGFGATEVFQDYSDLDFVDYDHLSREGAVKLPAEIAPWLRQRAREAGWID